jgi:hypothetical protein
MIPITMITPNREGWLKRLPINKPVKKLPPDEPEEPLELVDLEWETLLPTAASATLTSTNEHRTKQATHIKRTFRCFLKEFILAPPHVFYFILLNNQANSGIKPPTG